MTPEEIPQILIDILDKMAGKKHSRKGSVVACLAEILTKYEELKMSEIETALFKDELALVLFPDKSAQIIAKDIFGETHKLGLSENQWNILATFIRNE